MAETNIGGVIDVRRESRPLLVANRPELPECIPTCRNVVNDVEDSQFISIAHCWCIS